MWSAIASIIFNLLEKVGWKWWQEHKVEEVQGAKDKDMAATSAALQQRLRLWTRDK